jgi:hypothetical protein
MFGLKPSAHQKARKIYMERMKDLISKGVLFFMGIKIIEKNHIDHDIVAQNRSMEELECKR